MDFLTLQLAKNYADELFSGGGGGEYSEKYSTSEREVGTWINGQKLYQKTYSVALENTEGTATYDLNISNLDEIVFSEAVGVVNDNNEKVSYPLPYVDDITKPCYVTQVYDLGKNNQFKILNENVALVMVKYC